MAVLQPQKVIHDSSSLVAYALRKQLILSVGPPTGSKPFAEMIWQLASPGLRPTRNGSVERPNFLFCRPCGSNPAKREIRRSNAAITDVLQDPTGELEDEMSVELDCDAAPSGNNHAVA